MMIADAQREVRIVYLGAFVGTLVSSALWFLSGALGTWVAPRHGILSLALGGALIFPVTQLALRAMGKPASLSPENPFKWLAMQIAFTIPLTLPVVGGATMHRLDWFYPAMAIVVGAHYLPFITLYGMPQFGALAGLLISGGLMIGLYLPGSFAAAAWYTAFVLLVFAFILRSGAGRDLTPAKPAK